MKTSIILFLIDAIVINVGFLLAFLIRYGTSIPSATFATYKNSFIFLTIISLSVLTFLGVYKKRFSSSWELFRRIFLGTLLSTLMCIAFVYVFRLRWSKFPTSTFAIAFFINLLLLFKINQFLLKSRRRIRKKILVIGEGKFNDLMIGKADLERVRIDQIKRKNHYPDIDEIVICSKIPQDKEMGLITYLAQKMKIDIIFSPACYIKLLSEKINGNASSQSITTFVGRKKDPEEFFIRSMDIIGSLVLGVLSLPLAVMTAILIKATSRGPVLYSQKRIGKDGEVFTLYKFRTMIPDAEKQSGPVWATKDDPRVTRIGRFLRETRLDEFPQLVNVLLGHMSLVGPRPERPFFVRRHKALMEIRLAVRPGLTGLAQIRSAYDLNPKHKIKYDYLYIQRRSLLLNLYILAKTFPVMLLKKGT